MQPEKIYLSSPHMGENEIKFVNEAFETNWISPVGPNINGFEEDLSKYNHGLPVAALSSGTAAIHLALILLGVERDDEIICSSFTFSGSCNPIAYLGAKPVFVDSEAETWNLDPDLLEMAIKDRISNGHKPKAIIAVHLYGMPAKVDKIMEVANKNAIPVIEDAAEALGSTLNGKKLGTFGTIGIFSFNGNKIITTSGGGAMIASNKAYIDKAKFLSTQARDQAPHYQHSEIGYNYRLSNISAGIGRGQMMVLDERIKRRREIYENYRLKLEPLGVFFPKESVNSFSNRWLTTVLFDKKGWGYQKREQIRTELDKLNIESRPLWKPMHLQPVFSTAKSYVNGVSEKLFEEGLCLPSGSNMTNEQQNLVIDNIKKFLE